MFLLLCKLILISLFLGGGVISGAPLLTFRQGGFGRPPEKIQLVCSSLDFSSEK